LLEILFAPECDVMQSNSQLTGVFDWFAGMMNRLRPDRVLPGGVARYRYGQRGERIAERYLMRLGYRIAARNYRGGGAEIDLVAVDSGTVVFVEVKRRSNTGAGTPEEAVDGRKRDRIRRAAEAFTRQYRAGDRPVRFDVIAIRDEGRHHRLQHLKDAF
jgi:putative endonuclease